MEKEKIPYYLVISTNSYSGNFHSNLIGYVLGILDDESMEELKIYNIENEYLNKFYKEENKTQDDCLKELEEFLYETYQEVDDWYQNIFYFIETYKFKETIENKIPCNSIFIQLKKPLEGTWEEIIIKRIKKFFMKEINNEKDLKLNHLELLDENFKSIQKYI